LTLGIRLFEGLTLNANYTYLDWDTRMGRYRAGRTIAKRDPELSAGCFERQSHRQHRRAPDDFKAASPFGDTVTADMGLSTSHHPMLPWRMPLSRNKPDRQNPEPVQQKYDQADGFRALPFARL
jgi:hypothetical protein